MKTKRSPFNLIELTLAIAVVGIGVASIMALFIPAIDASRSSLIDSMTADTADTFIAYIQSMFRIDWENPRGIPKEKKASAISIMDEADNRNPVSWTSTVSGFENLYELNVDDGVYGIKSGNDFAVHLRIWYEDVSDFYVSNGGSVSDLSQLRRVIVEISWPLLKEHAKREKRYYITEIFKPGTVAVR